MGRMRSVGIGRFGQCAAVLAAVLVAAAVGFGSTSPSQAQLPDVSLLNKLQKLKKPPAGNAPAQVPKGMVGVPGGKGRGGVPLRPGIAARPGVGLPNAATMPNGRMPGTNGLPNNARFNPAMPNARTGIGLNAKA